MELTAASSSRSRDRSKDIQEERETATAMLTVATKVSFQAIGKSENFRSMGLSNQFVLWFISA
jgi:hypothetical protein